MKTFLNILWLILGGLIMGICYYIIGALFCITIIGIPIGKQYFKFGKLLFMPFGKEVKSNFDKHPILNIIWVVFIGWGMALGAFILGVFLCITIIGIPFGKQWFKLIKLVALPFGAEIKEAK